MLHISLPEYYDGRHRDGKNKRQRSAENIAVIVGVSEKTVETEKTIRGSLLLFLL